MFKRRINARTKYMFTKLTNALTLANRNENEKGEEEMVKDRISENKPIVCVSVCVCTRDHLSIMPLSDSGYSMSEQWSYMQLNLSFNFQTCSFNIVKCKYLPVSEVIFSKVCVLASGMQWISSYPVFSLFAVFLYVFNISMSVCVHTLARFVYSSVILNSYSVNFVCIVFWEQHFKTIAAENGVF